MRVARTPSTCARTCGKKLADRCAELRRDAEFAMDFTARHGGMNPSQAEQAQNHLNDAAWYVKTGNCQRASAHIRHASNKLRAFRQMVAREREYGR